MLCDRDNTNVAGSQPGFIGFVVMPLFTQLAHVMPELGDAITQLKSNLNAWKTYEETEEDKKVYAKKGQSDDKSISLMSKTDSIAEEQDESEDLSDSDGTPVKKSKEKGQI